MIRIRVGKATVTCREKNTQHDTCTGSLLFVWQLFHFGGDAHHPLGLGSRQPYGEEFQASHNPALRVWAAVAAIGKITRYSSSF